MRFFPGPVLRASRRRRTTLAAAGALVLGGLVVPFAAAADLDDKKGQVEKKIEQQHDHVDQSSAELEAATDALLRARDDLVAAQAHLAKTRGELAAAKALDQQMQLKLDQAIARLREARRALAAGRAEVEDQESDLRQMVVSAYESGDPALMGLSMVFTTQDPAQLAGQMNSGDDVVNLQTGILDRLEASKVLLTVKEADTESAKIEVAEKRKEAAENLRRMEALELQAREAEAAVSAMVSLRAQARDAALKAKSADLRTLAKLQAERDRIEDLIAQQASIGSGYTGPASGNGFLDYPVPGRVTSPYGWRTHPIWGYRSLHDGVDFGTSCGTPIRASAPGKVLATYYQSAWGNRVIVDHGVRYGAGVATIVNHLSGYAVSPGERVRRGQVIGYVGDTGWSTGCHLHYTVLENGQAVDPMRWF